MSRQRSYQEFTQDIKTALGWPSIDLELEDNHYAYATSRAIENYHKWAHGNGIDKDWVILNVSAGITTYEVPDDIRAVFSKQLGADFLNGDISQLFTMENMMWNTGALNVWSWGSFGLLTYELSLQYLDTMRQMLISKYNIRYKREENKVHISPPPPYNTTLFMECYREVPREFLYDNAWCLEWAIAECKEMLGRIRGKFSGAPGPGGTIQLDGNQMLNEAIQEKTLLRQRLVAEESPPPDFFIASLTFFLCCALPWLSSQSYII